MMRLLAHSGAGAAAGAEHRIVRGLWRLADPKIALASFVPFCAGLAIAVAHGGRLDAATAIAAFLAIFLVEVGKNAVNDLYDFRSGADTAVLPEERSPFSGGKRVLVEALLTEHDLVVIAGCSFVLAAIVGIAVAMTTQPALLLVGAAAALLSVVYAMPPLQLSYRGLGETAVFLVYGPGIVLAAAAMAEAAITAGIVVASVVLGIFVAVILIANEIPDERPDRSAGKRTLVVRLGRQRAEALIGVLLAAAIAIALLAALVIDEAAWLAGVLVCTPAAMLAWRALLRTPAAPPVEAQALLIVTYVLAGSGMAIAALSLPR